MFYNGKKEEEIEGNMRRLVVIVVITRVNVFCLPQALTNTCETNLNAPRKIALIEIIAGTLKNDE